MTNSKQRGKGTGSVYRNSRGQYVATIEAGWTVKGTRRRITLKAKSLAEARARLKEMQKQIANAGIPAATGNVTIKQWAEHWLANRQRTVRPGTFVADRSAIEKWIVPTIGQQRLDSMTPADIRKVAAKQEEAGSALPSMQRTHAVLAKLLTDAVGEGYLVPQRAREAPGPGNGHSSRQALSAEAASKILKVALTKPDSSRWVAALLQGLRPAEALGLTWDMIDFEAGTMTLSWQLKSLPYQKARNPESGFRVPRGFESIHIAGAFHLVRPKTQAGVRIIPLVPWLADELARWKEIAPASEVGLVWPRADGLPQSPESDRKRWYEIAEKAKVKVALPGGGTRLPLLYEARHTAATLLLANGVDETTIKAILGHSTVLSTKSYLHADLTRTREALEASAKILGIGSSNRRRER